MVRGSAAALLQITCSTFTAAEGTMKNLKTAGKTPFQKLL